MIQANATRARLIVEELVRCGIDRFILAPGFRSAPLALATISHPSTHVTVHFDERGNAFFALGYGRATRKPCVWITTSGTAVANGFPAVIESAMDSVPMICLTADRPAELRDTGANQTIDQVHLFGRYPRWFVDLPAPEMNENEAFIRTTINHAVHQAREGPVHLNCMFREPLIEQDDKNQSIPKIPWSLERLPKTSYAPRMRKTGTVEDRLLQKINGAKRGLIVAGRLQTTDEGKAISTLAEHLGWPFIADICAPVLPVENQVFFFDLIARSTAFTSQYTPDVVLHFGGPLVSKDFQKILVHSDFEDYIMIAPSSNRIDPFHALTDRIQESIDHFCNSLLDVAPDSKPDPAWLDLWMYSDATVRETLSSALGNRLSEPSIAWNLSDLLGNEEWILSASSMPIRDLQIFFQRKKTGSPRIFSNRGASGIDGTLATAAGIAQAQSGRGTILLGDLALLHDLNSLSLLKEQTVTIVAINNDGGGIFHMLPIALEHKKFEQVLGTPHGMNFRHAAEQFEIPYSLVDSWDRFQKAWLSASSSSVPHLIEVQTDRKENAQLHNTLYGLVNEAVQTTIQNT